MNISWHSICVERAVLIRENFLRICASIGWLKGDTYGGDTLAVGFSRKISEKNLPVLFHFDSYFPDWYISIQSVL